MKINLPNLPELQINPSEEDNTNVRIADDMLSLEEFQEFVKEELHTIQRNVSKCLAENQRRVVASVAEKSKKLRINFGSRKTALQTDMGFLRSQVGRTESDSEALHNNMALVPVNVPGAINSDDEVLEMSNTITNNKNPKFSKHLSGSMDRVPVPLMILAQREPPTLSLPVPELTSSAVTTPPSAQITHYTSVTNLKPGQTNDGLVSASPRSLAAGHKAARNRVRIKNLHSDSSIQVDSEPTPVGVSDMKASQSVHSDDVRIYPSAFFHKQNSRSSFSSFVTASHSPAFGPRDGRPRHLSVTGRAKTGINEPHMHGVFADAESMKERVRAAIGKEEYNVVHFYKESGCCQAIARSQVFEFSTLTIIALNAVWIGIDTDYNKTDTLADAPILFQIIENIFCTFFVAEWAIRLAALKRICDGFRDYWFVFDGALVVLMVIETWIMYAILHATAQQNSTASERLGNASILKVLRLLRLTRMARMVRLLRAIPELMILVKGMAVATRSVFFTLCLLVVIIYIFGIAFTQLTLDTNIGAEYFKTVLASMNTLLLYGTFLEDTPDVINAVGDESNLLRAIFLLFILLASLTVMNMLVGVLVEVVSVVSSVEKETLQVNFVKGRLAQIISDYNLDANKDGQVSKAEFEMLLSNPEATRALRDVGVDVVGLVDFHDFLFQDGQDFSFENFMQVVLSLRGTNKATVKDIVDFRKWITSELGRIEEKLTAMLESCGASRCFLASPRNARRSQSRYPG